MTLFLFANAGWAQAMSSRSVRYEVRSKFREGACEVITAQRAMRRALKHQVIYIASCAGLETLLMAAKRRGTSVEAMR